jgi:hypothetical protein
MPNQKRRFKISKRRFCGPKSDFGAPESGLRTEISKRRPFFENHEEWKMKNKKRAQIVAHFQFYS